MSELREVTIAIREAIAETDGACSWEATDAVHAALEAAGMVVVPVGLLALARAGEELRETWVETGGGDLEGNDMLDMLERSGVVAPVDGGYSREKHGETSEHYAEDGDPWWMETGPAYKARLWLEEYDRAAAREEK